MAQPTSEVKCAQRRGQCSNDAENDATQRCVYARAGVIKLFEAMWRQLHG